MSAAKSCPHNSLGGAGWCPTCSPITDPRPMALPAKPARPVRVGDLLSHRNSPDWKKPFAKLEPSGWLTAGHDVRAFTDQVKFWSHASDGAPIDVEASLAIARGEPTVVVGNVRAYDGVQVQRADGSVATYRAFSETEDGKDVRIAAQERRIAELEAMRPGHSEGCDRKLATAQERIKMLEASYDALRTQTDMWRDGMLREQQLANRRGDECGALKTQVHDLEAENGRLRRKLEAAERKAKR